MKRIPPVLPLALAALLAPTLAGAVTFTAYLTQDLPDANPGDGVCSYLPVENSPPLCTLRAAIMEGNATPANQSVTVRLAPGATYVLDTPEPQQQPPDARTGDLDITRPMTIGIADGAAPRARIDANKLSRAFSVHPDAKNTHLYGIEITGGAEPALGGSAIGSHAGGVIFEFLDIHDNIVSGNIGLGCALEGNFTLLDSRVHHNGTEERPVIGICGLGPLTIARSTIDNNSAGGLRTTNGSLWLHSSTVSNNSGDGIFLIESNATISNSTISANGSLDNVADQISISADDQAIIVVLSGSIVDSTGQDRDCGLSADDPGEATLHAAWNLYSDDSCVSDTPDLHSIVSTAINLSDLGNWGGPTPTRMPMAGSDAIDFAPEAVCNQLDTDQRGFPRPVSSDNAPMPRCDIGAVEVQPEVQEPDDPPLGPIFTDSFEGA